MDMLHILDVPDRRTGASPGARKTILSYRYFIRVQWFVNRRTQHGLIHAKFVSRYFCRPRVMDGQNNVFIDII